MNIEELITMLTQVEDQKKEIIIYVSNEHYRGRFSVKEIHGGAVGNDNKEYCAIELKSEALELFKPPISQS